MKKLIALLLALTMLLSLAACGKKTETEEPEKAEPEYEESSEEKTLLWEEESAEEADKPAEEPEAPEEAPAEDADEPAEAPEEAPEEEPEEEPAPEAPAEEETGVSLGATENGAYLNEDLGYGCDLDDSWIFFDEQQIAELNQFAIDAYDDEAIREQLSNVNMFYDMVAQNITGTGMIQIMVENLGVIYGTILTEDQYIEISLSNLETQLPAAGYTNVVAETVAIDFAGEQRSAISVYGEINGIAVYQLMVPVKVGNQMAVYAVATYLEDNTAEYISYFYALD